MINTNDDDRVPGAAGRLQNAVLVISLGIFRDGRKAAAEGSARYRSLNKVTYTQKEFTNEWRFHKECREEEFRLQGEKETCDASYS